MTSWTYLENMLDLQILIKGSTIDWLQKNDQSTVITSNFFLNLKRLSKHEINS